MPEPMQMPTIMVIAVKREYRSGWFVPIVLASIHVTWLTISQFLSGNKIICQHSNRFFKELKTLL
jgi:hypothetical protein